MKTLILSDIHYPISKISTIEEILNQQKPDNVILLGDIIEPFNGMKSILDLHKEFIQLFSKIFPMNKTVYILGDNDYEKDKGIEEYLNKLEKVNDDLFIFKSGNMMFYHGNIENNNKLMESFGLHIGRVLDRINENIFPLLLSVVINVKLVSPKYYKFIGHIHLLKKLRISKTTFCGTLNPGRIIYSKEKSLGYIIINHYKPFTVENFDDIKLIHILDG